MSSQDTNVLDLLRMFTLLVFLTNESLSAQQEFEDVINDEVAFDNDIQPIVKNFCVTCHAGKEPDGDLRLTSYADVKKHVEQGELLKRINDSKDPMPPKRQLPLHMRRLFRRWAETGYREKGKPRKGGRSKMNLGNFKPPKIVPVDIGDKGFGFLEKLQGHWVGSMELMGQKMDWMAFDYRAIAPSHIHAIFEGGTVGNLFTSFFVAKYKGKATLMARNGGILNGIYRTSYFVLDKVEPYRDRNGATGSYYRFVDAIGGAQIMYMELTFLGEFIQFDAFTSRFGLSSPPQIHMSFRGKKTQLEISKLAAQEVGFPKKVVDRDFSSGLPAPRWLEKGEPQTSASYIWEQGGQSVQQLGKLANDPYCIDQMPHLAELKVTIRRNADSKNEKLLLFLSSHPLTRPNGKWYGQSGYLREDVGNTILMYPQVAKTESEFNFTYLHPGKYFLTVVADLDEDSYPGPGDITSRSVQLVVKPESKSSVLVKDLIYKN